MFQNVQVYDQQECWWLLDGTHKKEVVFFNLKVKVLVVCLELIHS